MTGVKLMAILRGISPDECSAIGSALYEAGWRYIEVPLNSPEPLDSIAALRDLLPGDCRVGAGTVLTVEEVRDARLAGAELIVSPNTRADVIRATRDAGMESYPGVATPSEALAALDAGATALKLFPAETIGIAGMKAWRPVLPAATELIPVGGVSHRNLSAWISAGATGAGFGSALYRPRDNASDVALRARVIVASTV